MPASSPLDGIEKLASRVLLVVNADEDMLNVRDIRTDEQFWIETTGRFLVFECDRKASDG